MPKCITIIGRTCGSQQRMRPTHDWAEMLTGAHDNVVVSRLDNGDYAVTVTPETPEYAAEHIINFGHANDLQTTVGCTRCPRNNTCPKRTKT